MYLKCIIIVLIVLNYISKHTPNYLSFNSTSTNYKTCKLFNNVIPKTIKQILNSCYRIVGSLQP